MHFASSLALQQQPPTFPGKDDGIVAGSFSPKFEDYVWSTAVNFKKYIGNESLSPSLILLLHNELVYDISNTLHLPLVYPLIISKLNLIMIKTGREKREPNHLVS